MADSEPRLVKGQAGHGGGFVHGQPLAQIPGEGAGQGSEGDPEGFPGQRIRKPATPFSPAGFQGVGKHIEAGIGNEGLGQILQQVVIQNGVVRLQFLIHKGVLGASVGQNCEIRHLRTGAGGGGNRCQPGRETAEIAESLGAVQGAAAPEGNDQIGIEILHPGGSGSGQFHGGIRENAVEDFISLCLCCFDHPLCGAVLCEIGIRYHKQPPGAQIGKGKDAAGAGDYLGFAGELLHLIHRLF